MSRIKAMIQEAKAEIGMEIMDKTKTSVTIRVHEFTLFCIDKLVSELDSSRASVCLSLVEEGVLDGLEALGHTEESIKAEWIQKREKEFEAARKKGGK